MTSGHFSVIQEDIDIDTILQTFDSGPFQNLLSPHDTINLNQMDIGQKCSADQFF